ncbi:MAG: cytochrome C, partial [Burkholderiales bacterium]
MRIRIWRLHDWRGAVAGWVLTLMGGVALASPLAAPAPAPAAGGQGEWAVVKPGSKSTADHSKFKELKGPFKSGSEVTKACLGCHTEAARQVMGTRHWTWEYTNPDTGQKLGKKTMLNSFCIGDRSNEAFCQSCHVGYGWKDDSFDFMDESKVDCLVCHHTGGYRKPAGMAGEVPVERTELPPGSGKFIDPVDLAMVAQHIGKTSTATCGSCHYAGGGGDGVKHGDLDESLYFPRENNDVHMGGDLNMQCVDCHWTENHQILGRML